MWFWTGSCHFWNWFYDWICCDKVVSCTRAVVKFFRLYCSYWCMVSWLYFYGVDGSKTIISWKRSCASAAIAYGGNFSKSLNCYLDRFNFIGSLIFLFARHSCMSNLERIDSFSQQAAWCCIITRRWCSIFYWTAFQNKFQSFIKLIFCQLVFENGQSLFQQDRCTTLAISISQLN